MTSGLPLAYNDPAFDKKLFIQGYSSSNAIRTQSQENVLSSGLNDTPLYASSQSTLQTRVAGPRSREGHETLKSRRSAYTVVSTFNLQLEIQRQLLTLSMSISVPSL
jgi:hypothetical protein